MDPFWLGDMPWTGGLMWAKNLPLFNVPSDVDASYGEFVRALYGEKLPTWEDVEAKRKARELDEKLRDLATEVMARGSFTNVSNEAMRYRLLDLKLVADASNPQRSLL